MKEKIKAWTKKILLFIANPRLLLCFAIAWMITNGWAYILFGLGTYFGITWMTAVGGAYLAFLWLPISPEKIVTCAIAVALLRWFFPDDTKTLAVLKEMHAKAKGFVQKKKTEHEEKKEHKTSD